MSRNLTKKQREFIDEYIETGNGTQSALEVYDIDPNGKDPKKTASVIATENLGKHSIREEITKRITLEDIDKAHKSLLDAVRLDYFVFPKSMSDEEITSHVEAQGLTCLNIRPSDKGKLAFFTLPDGMSRSKAIEIWHKVQGTYAPEKQAHVHVHVEANPRLKELAKKLNAH